jgi:hypothetical protein
MTGQKRKFYLLGVILLFLFFTACIKRDTYWFPQPPVAGLEVPRKSFIIDPTKDTLLILKNGTEIFVPAGALVNLDGKPVEGEFQLRYREFHDALDILLSGIHMDFYSMGERRTFQTAGMLEIDARQGESVLEISAGHRIDIRMASMYQGDDYSFFFMDPGKGQWEWVDLPPSEINYDKIDAQNALNESIPELYMGSEFFILNYERFLDVALNDNWNDISRLRKSDAMRQRLESYNVDIYNMEIGERIRFLNLYYDVSEILWRNVDGNPFPMWIRDFKSIVRWNSEISRWENLNTRFRDLGNNIYNIRLEHKGRVFTKDIEAILPLRNLLRQPAATWEENYETAMEQVREEQMNINLMAETFRSFSINRLGVYNFDKLLNMDGWFQVYASYLLEGDKVDFLNNSVYMVLGDNSGYMTINTAVEESIPVNPANQHVLFSFLPDGRIVLFTPEKFMELDADSLQAMSRPEVILNLEAHNAETVGEIREKLGFDRF